MSNKTTPSTGDRNNNVPVEEVSHDKIKKIIEEFFGPGEGGEVKCIIGQIGVPSIDPKAYTKASIPKYVKEALNNGLTFSLNANPSPQKTGTTRRTMPSTRGPRPRTTTSTKKTARNRGNRENGEELYK